MEQPPLSASTPMQAACISQRKKKWTKETNINRRLAKAVLWRTARLMPLFTTGYQAAAAIHMPFMAVVFLTAIFELPFELFNRRSHSLSAQRESVRESQGDRNICLFVSAYSLFTCGMHFFLSPLSSLFFFLVASCIWSIVGWVFPKHLTLYWWSSTNKPSQSLKVFYNFFLFFSFSGCEGSVSSRAQSALDNVLL